jgi:excinuclease ABC subunit C
MVVYMKLLQDKIKKLPTSPGVYVFKDTKNKTLYIGKAASLKDRVGSYFNSRNEFARPIDFAIDQIVNIETKKTDSVLEAYFLEQELIKKYQPKYNVLGKDDKSFVYVCLTRDEFPRFEIKRKTDLEGIFNFQFSIPNDKISKAIPYKKIYGPYTSRLMIEAALKILRKIFPYHNRRQKTEKGCLDAHIGLCPAPYDGKISNRDYMKNIQSIEAILRGKKGLLVRNLEKKMQRCSQRYEYEKAIGLRNTIFALRHIHDVALITQEEVSGSAKNSKLKIKNFRIEGYDISNISGKFATGSMVVFDNFQGEIEPNKKEYRKFKIKAIEKANDVAALGEVLRRRFKNSWRIPNLILVDGGKGHLNETKRVLRENHYDIPVVAVAKGPNRKKLDLYYQGRLPRLEKNIIEQVRNEAHRFAIGYHRKLRGKSLLNSK